MLKFQLVLCSLLFLSTANAQVKFEESYGGSKSDMGRDVLAVGNGYIVAGSSMNATNGEYDMFLMKTDPLGAQLWSSTFGDVNCEQGFAVAQTSGGDLVVVGSALQVGRPESRLRLVETDRSLKIFCNGECCEGLPLGRGRTLLCFGEFCLNRLE